MKFYYLKIVFFLSLMSCQKEVLQMHSNSFILPSTSKSYIASVENNSIIYSDSIDIPYNSKNIILPNKCIASVDSVRFKLYDKKGSEVFVFDDFEVICLNNKGSIVYFGGKRNEAGEIVGFIDTNKKEFEFHKIEIPIKLTYGKAIDDILIRGNSLFLVDNILYPKYLFKYDITNPSSPKFLETINLEVNGTYEHIHKGVINDDFIVLLSTTAGRSGKGYHLTRISNDFDYSTITIFNEWKEENKQTIDDITLINDTLFVIESGLVKKISLNGEFKMENLQSTSIKKTNVKYIMSSNGKLITY